MLTAQRRGEVAAMQWNDIDTTKAVWTIPTDRTKNGKPYAVPLSPSALALLATIHLLRLRAGHADGVDHAG